MVDGRVVGHVLDPRTGFPVDPWGSVTVVTEEALVADALATALFVMGPEDAMRWAATHPEVGVLVLTADGDDLRPSASPGLGPYLVCIGSGVGTLEVPGCGGDRSG